MYRQSGYLLYSEKISVPMQRLRNEWKEAYRDQQRWSRMAMMNTICSGKFSSDRTIEEYVSDIWKLEKVDVAPLEE